MSKLWSSIKQFSVSHRLYMRLHIALACMLVTVVMMFAGALFLYDYVAESLDILSTQQAKSGQVSAGSGNAVALDSKAMVQDIKSKQSAILLLQLAGVILLFWIVAAVLIDARRLLVTRVSRMLTTFPNENSNAGAWDANADEMDRIEELVTRKAILLEGAKAELSWLNKTSSERINRLMLAHDFFGMLITVFTESELTEKKLSKLLQSLEKTLAANNVGLLLYKNTTLGLDGEPIFTRHIPTGYPAAALYQGGTTLAMAVLPSQNGQQYWRCMSVPLSLETEMLGMLVVETAESHYFEDTEIQLAEITAKLLASALSVQTREQEGRRVALLEERAAIARELHDSLAQTFSYMKIQLARFPSSAMPSQADTDTTQTEIIQNLRLGLNEAYRELRELLATFRVQISTRGLDVAVKEAIEEFSLRSSLSISLDNRLGNFSFTVNEQLHVLHIIREALSNVIRHADAKHAEVSLVLQSNGEVMVMIDDDGVGVVDSVKDGQHYGVAMIKERANSLGGGLDVMPRRSGGTRVRLVFRPKLA
ncbi:MAG: histidine kinase [Pseudomonadota bacterium]